MIINLIFWEFRPVFDIEIYLSSGSVIRERYLKFEWIRSNNKITKLDWTRYENGIGLNYIELDTIQSVVTKRIDYRFVRKRK